MKTRKWKRLFSLCTAVVLSISAAASAAPAVISAATTDISDTMTWDTVRIGGGGFVSGVVTGKEAMYARTDVGGAYKFNFETNEWEQLFAFLNEAERGYLSVDAMAIDPTDDDTVYFLCGCAYFSGAGTRIYKTTDGGKTFTYTDVTDLIQVHGNGYGRQCGEAIAVDPDNPDVIYCGGDVTAGDSALIRSQDGGKTWEPVAGYDDLGYFAYTVNWPEWETHPVRAATTSNEKAYAEQNGVACIAITDGKVYVGTSVNNTTNVVVADVDTNAFTPLSAELPTEYYPSRLVLDTVGNLYITYMQGITLGGGSGAIYKYNTQSNELKDITPENYHFGGISADPDHPDNLIASTCNNSANSQLWYEGAWEDQNVAWGERFYRSTDGGETWEQITPGNAKAWGQPLMADYLQDGGYDWIRNKSIHWSGSAVIDPTDSNRFFVTSGNGVFKCEELWSDLPVFTFHPNGIEEVVALDMVSVPGGNAYSAIGDYDGFEHVDVDVPGKQHAPNMGSTCAIAYCPQNPDVMVRIAEKQNDTASGFYTLDGGDTWTKMSCSYGGKAAITQLEDGTYRIFQSKGDGDKSTAVSYTDDFGATWHECQGIPTAYGSKSTHMLVEPEQPNMVYAYVTYYNESWHYSKPAPTAEDAQYKLCVSTDYGATFTPTDICMYDQCDSAGRIAYLGEGELILGGGWYGMYHASVSESGSVTVEKLDSVFYCKTVGYGAPEKDGGVNTLYMYGKPAEDDAEGIYRSTDGGETWVCINTDHLYGGTGNGNFLVGDMNTFGVVYMSTVGCGIVYGQVVGTQVTPPDDDDKTVRGDTNCNGTVEIADVILLNRIVAEDATAVFTEQGAKNAEVTGNNQLNSEDSVKILCYLAGLGDL